MSAQRLYVKEAKKPRIRKSFLAKLLGFLILLIVLGVVTVSGMAGLMWYKFIYPVTREPLQKNQIKHIPVVKAASTDSLPHLVSDTSLRIDRIHIITLYLSPKDISVHAPENMQEQINGDFQAALSFWENELDEKATITLEKYSSIINGTKKSDEYDGNSAYNDILNRVRENRAYAKYFDKTATEFPVFAIYILSNKKLSGMQDAVGYTTENSGVMVMPLVVDPKNAIITSTWKTTAHLFGHALGLSDADASKSNTCDVMRKELHTGNQNAGDTCLPQITKNLFFTE